MKPFKGNKDVTGQLVVPVDRVNFGHHLAMLLGNPTTTPSTPDDIKTGAPNIVISSGVATLSVEQTAWQVGDQIIYNTNVTAYIKSITSTTVCVLVDAYGLDTVVDVAASPAKAVVSIKRIIFSHVFKVNSCDELPSFVLETHDCSHDIPIYQLFKGLKINGMSITANGAGDQLIATFDIMGATYVKSTDVKVASTITIGAAGDVDFSAAQADAVVDDMIIYDTDYKVAFITVKTDGSNMTAKTTRGGSVDPGQVSTKTVQAILHNADYIGGGAIDIAEHTFSRYEMADGSAKEGGVSTELLRTLSMNVSNNLDGDGFTIGGGGVRRRLPSGIAGVSGSISAVFEDDTILEKANEDTETSLELAFTHPDGESSLTFNIDELEYQFSSPDIAGPQGVVLDLDFQAYYQDDADATAIKVTLVNLNPAYDA